MEKISRVITIVLMVTLIGYFINSSIDSYQTNEAIKENLKLSNEVYRLNIKKLKEMGE